MYFSDAEREALKRLIKIGQAITYAPDQHLQAGSFLQAEARAIPPELLYSLELRIERSGIGASVKRRKQDDATEH